MHEENSYPATAVKILQRIAGSGRQTESFSAVDFIEESFAVELF